MHTKLNRRLVRRTRLFVMALLWCWCEGPLWLRPILEDSHFMPACDTSNMASVFTLIYAHDVRTGAKFAPRSLFAAKLVGRSGDGPRFAGGPKTSRPPGAGAKRRPPLASADIGRKQSLTSNMASVFTYCSIAARASWCEGKALWLRRRLDVN